MKMIVQLHAMTSQATVHKHVADQQAGCLIAFRIDSLSTFNHAGLGERYLGHGTRLGTLQQMMKLRFAVCPSLMFDHVLRVLGPNCHTVEILKI